MTVVVPPSSREAIEPPLDLPQPIATDVAPPSSWFVLDRAVVAQLIGFVALALSVGATFLLIQSHQAALQWVIHTRDVERKLQLTLSELENAETSQRGYLLTGSPEYLEPYNGAVAHLGATLEGLASVVADNPPQVGRADFLKATVNAELDELRGEIEQHRSNASNDVSGLAREKGLMDSCRQIIDQMMGEEEQLLAVRRTTANREEVILKAGVGLSAILVMALAIFVFRDLEGRIADAFRVRDSLALANKKLISEAESRRVAEAQVRQMQKLEAVGQLTGGVAHDFNNMLAIILGSLQLAQRRIDGNIVKAKACIENAIDGATRAAQLTARLLAFSRQQPLAPKVLDVNKLVGGMSELLRRTIGEHLQVESVLAGGLWSAHADPDQLENAIVNLAVNARDAMPDGGRLTIETSNAYLDDTYASSHAELHAGLYVLIAVSDTGVGMPPDVVERAFDPFYTTKGAGKGTGLGLSQVHGFVKQSGGHVKIYSEAGLGTTVKLYLPRFSGTAAAPTPKGSTTAAIPASSASEIILVVEDDENVRHVSVDSLRELGYTVIQAADATQALAVLQTQPRVDLLFTDIVMPDMNGRRLADKAREARSDLKVLYTTGYTKNAVVHNGVLDADVALLPKPFSLEQLALKVRQTLGGK